MHRYPLVRLKIRRNVDYPLVWQRMVAEAPAVEPGDCVSVVDKAGTFVGHGFWCPTSQIAVRILTGNPDETIDADFLAERLRAAIAFRRDVLGLHKQGVTAYRLLNAEGDGLSGLILDRYDHVVVAELYSIGFYRRLDVVREILTREVPGAILHAQADPGIQEKEGFSLAETPPPPVRVEENGIRYTVDFRLSHKTGFFLDQRENRARVRRYAAGRRVLDACCFTGGFALNAARGGAAEVTGIDLDEKAIAVAKKNAAHNQLRVRFVHVDTFAYLRDMARTGKDVDLVILDPAKLARTRDDVPDALKTQFDFHRTVLPVIRPGGILVTCSCSALITEEAFITSLVKAGRRCEREVRVFGLTGPSADHPYSLHFPEGRYLKVVWARVL